LRLTSGWALVNGFDVRTRQAQVRQSIGLISRDPSLDDKLTVRENLKFHAMLYDVPTDVLVKRSEQLLEMVDLSERADEVTLHYSGGSVALRPAGLIYTYDEPLVVCTFLLGIIFSFFYPQILDCISQSFCKLMSIRYY